jgi:hypothetical protein
VVAVAVVLMGVGVYLMYEAYKSKTPAPVARAKAAVKAGKLGG